MSASSDRVIIFDTTLRDGEQSPGCTMSLSEKILLAHALEGLGVDVMEAGFAAASPGDFEAVNTIAKEVDSIVVTSLARALESDIEAAAKAIEPAKNKRIHTFLATSPLHMEYKLRKSPAEVLKMIEKAVRFAASCTADVEFSCEDASRSDKAFLVEACEAAIAAGAKTLNIPDTVGYAQPEEYGKLIAHLKEHVKGSENIVFSVHCHNDLGLAVANSLAALKAGARQAEVTVGGIGERAGNASLEELAMALTVRKPYYNLNTNIKTQHIYPTARLLSRIIGQTYARNKPILGANAFAHESGIHQAGVLSNPETYEIMTPASIGLTDNNAIVIGKHSGRSALKSKLDSMGYQLEDAQIDKMMLAIKVLADKKKQIFDEDIEALVVEKVHRVPDKFRLVHLSILSSDIGVPPTCMLVMEKDGKECRHAGFGVGSVDAVFKTICHVCEAKPTIEEYSVNSISGGSDAQGEVFVRLAQNGRVAIGRASDPDVINASAKAFINALNRLAKN